MPAGHMVRVHGFVPKALCSAAASGGYFYAAKIWGPSSSYDPIVSDLMIVFVFSQFSEDKKKRYEEIRKRVTNDLLSMPSESASQEVATPSTSGDAEKPKKSKEEI